MKDIQEETNEVPLNEQPIDWLDFGQDVEIPGGIDRRTVLRATAGLLSIGGLSGMATADRQNYGNGNGVGAFLNEDAVLKDRPIWDSGVADMTGQSEVEVSVGTLTSVDIPQYIVEQLPPGTEVPEKLPVAFDPHAVKVSPGTDVTWKWVSDHHSVTSYNAGATAPDEHGQLFNTHGDVGHEFTYTFEEVGNYLYFCHPHGTPYPVPFGPLFNEPNHTGMRGAVLVSDE